MSAKLIYRDVAPGADTDCTVNAIGAGATANVSRLPAGVTNPDFASLEINKWGGGGKVRVYNGEALAFLSAATSGADGAFASPPMLTLTFGSKHTSLGISFRFASESVDYASSLTLAWYQGTTRLAEKTFYPDAPTYFCEQTVQSFNKLVITIHGTNLPYRYARIEQILFGIVREFDGYEIGDVNILQQINLLSAEVAINTLDWTLRSRTGVDYIFQLKQPVLAYNSETLLGVFYIDDRAKRTAENTYQIPCSDALGVLDSDPFPAAIYTGKNAATLLREISGSMFTLEIDAAFAASTVTGYIPDCSRREAMQQVAFAIGAVIDTSGSESIRVYPAPTALSAIPAARTYTGGSVEQDAIVTSVVVTYHTYTAGSGTNGDEVITVGGTKYVHTTGTVRVDNPDVAANDKKNVKTVSEATLVNAANAAQVAARVYAYYQRRNKVNSKFVVVGEKPGDYVSIPTAWGQSMTGHIESMKIRLSNTTAADVTIKAVTQ